MAVDHRPNAGATKDPEWRKRRAINASRKAHSVETLVATLIRRAPELNEDIRSQLRALLADSNGGQQANG